ncbi:MAG: glycosyltransferase family 4 protein [Bacteroidales bacterium]|jgi:glycosyltransferase involved in cell wall biosynthesis|nr:glycosyltransferase family 4 protein [Bacteroidales bacterium]
MRILITAPSLDVSRNVSGISMVANTILTHADKDHLYYHYLLGRPDHAPGWYWPLLLIKQLIGYPFFLYTHQIDCVHQNLPFNAKGILREYLINLLSVRCGRPVLLHIHGGEGLVNGISSRFLNRLVNKMFRRSSQILVLSALEQKVIQQSYPTIKVSYLSNAIDTELYARKKTESKTVPALLYLGRIEPNKGINEIIRAVAKVYKQHRFTFFLCGEGPEREHMVRACAEIMGEDFCYKGVVSGEQKLEIVHQSSIFVLPSYFEGLPMSLLESMAGGVVPVVTEVGSMKEVIRSGENGLHVKMQDANDLAEKLTFLLTHPEMLDLMAENAVCTVQKEFGIKDYMKRLSTMYDSLFL